MASRRDELNAYTFARKRTVGAFLLPSGGGSDEDAPRPFKAVMPSIVVGALICGGFGLWGVMSPSAPVGWDSGKNIIQGKKSTTRYVVLTDPDGKTKRLHQVLNMSSARLVLPVDAKVVVVSDDVLDAYKNHGPIIGIPYAPDKLPAPAKASQPMKWSVCDRPGADTKGDTVSEAVFVAAGAEAKNLAAKDRMLDIGQTLFVQESDGQQITSQQGGTGQPGQSTQPPKGNQSTVNLYLVDARGVKYPVGDTQDSIDTKTDLANALFGTGAKPQKVSKEWLKTLPTSSKPISFPNLGKGFDPKATAPNSSVQLANPEDRRVGRVLKSDDKYFVVGADELIAITPFQAELIRRNPAIGPLYKGNPTLTDLSPAEQSKYGRGTVEENKLNLPTDWPKEQPSKQVNDLGAPKGPRNVVCSTFDGMDADGKTVKRSIWAWSEYPAQFGVGSGTAHVTAGYGLFYRAMDAAVGGSGSDFLITETGLRYSVPSNDDGGKGKDGKTQPSQQPTQAAPSAAPQGGQGGQPEIGGAQARLGYKDIRPTLVPREWSDLVTPGSVLNTKSAAQERTS
ncbi:type VII secretion protein EccB [Kitasatospora sp. NPDC050543]|uniref:type VII secretion protein EccB n=1 Tax=Kitasatospora sp. NPDC050543 TaxID=3364054 RepID=UPI0037A87D65